jgi:hypothetical protein
MGGWSDPVTEVFSCRWRLPDGESVLAIGHRPGPEGREWLLLAGVRVWSETLPFEDASQVREFARAVLELPTSPEWYERGFGLSRRTKDGEWERTHSADLVVALDPSDGYRPYLSYQSYYEFQERPKSAALGLQVLLEDPARGPLRAQARALLAALAESP